MESRRIYPQNKEFVPMAHKIETTDNGNGLSFSLIDAARKIGEDSTKSDLIAAFASFNMTIEQFMVHFEISQGSIDSVRQKKAEDNGRFVKRAYIDIPYFGKKLVRDKLPFDGQIPRTDKAGFVDLLKKKIQEETKELITANGEDNRVEELGDVFEAMDTLREMVGISPKEVKEKISQIKLQQRRQARREKKKDLI